MQQNKDTLLTRNPNCIETNFAEFICISESCKKNAFICQKSSCSCQQQHQNCKILATKEIQNKIISKRNSNTITEETEQQLQRVLKVYDDIIDMFSTERMSFIQSMELFGLGQYCRNYIKMVNEGEQGQINGNYMAEIASQLLSEENVKFDILNHEQIQQTIDYSMNLIDKVITKIYKFHISSHSIEAKLPSVLIDSKGEKIIKDFLNFKPIQKFELLFRASEHLFAAQAFHEKTQGVGDTIIIVKTQFGNIIGGYTPLKWKKIAFGEFQKDPSNESFLFSVTLNQKFKLKGENSFAICHNKKNGPLFGGDNNLIDLGIYDNCNFNGGWTSFSNSYGNNKYMSKSQSSYTAFAGQPSGWNFLIVDYEVFKVHWKPKKMKVQSQ